MKYAEVYPLIEYAFVFDHVNSGSDNKKGWDSLDRNA